MFGDLPPVTNDSDDLHTTWTRLQSAFQPLQPPPPFADSLSTSPPPQRPVGREGVVNHINGMGYGGEVTNNTANIDLQLSNGGTSQAWNGAT